jgi:hypothetical protein
MNIPEDGILHLITVFNTASHWTICRTDELIPLSCNITLWIDFNNLLSLGLAKPCVEY